MTLPGGERLPTPYQTRKARRTLSALAEAEALMRLANQLEALAEDAADRGDLAAHGRYLAQMIQTHTELEGRGVPLDSPLWDE